MTDNAKVGELVQRLVSAGQLLIGDGLNDPSECGYFVKWNNGPKTFIATKETLIESLEKVDTLVAKYS